MISHVKKAAGQHALVVGGTGMLRRVALFLADQGYTVSVVARQMNRLISLVKSASNSRGVIVPISVDYRHDRWVVEALRDSIARHGPISLAVCWIHSTAPNALRTVGETIAATTSCCRLFHVRGSAATNPARFLSLLPTWLQVHPQLHYRQVILGFVVEDDRSRWLTHDEIARGVMTAMKEDAAQYIVGTVEPWSDRP